MVSDLNEAVISSKLESRNVVAEDSRKEQQKFEAPEERSPKNAATEESEGCHELVDSDDGYDVGNNDD